VHFESERATSKLGRSLCALDLFRKDTSARIYSIPFKSRIVRKFEKFQIPAHDSLRFPSESRKSRVIRSPLEQISWRAFQCITKLIQNVSAIAFATSVKKGVERWVSDARLLLKFVASPAPVFENFLQFADDHVGTLDQKADYVNSLAYIKCTLHIAQSRYNRPWIESLSLPLAHGPKGLTGAKSPAKRPVGPANVKPGGT
jgi:hypothetical protein